MSHDPDFVIRNQKLVSYQGEAAHVVIPEGITAIKPFAFFNGPLRSVTIPDSVTCIGPSAFRECEQLTRLTLPDREISIDSTAFMGCIGLADPEGFVIIQNRLYQYCGPGGDVVIPDGVTSIAPHAFSFCETVTSVTVPDTVTEIGDGAFGNCCSLTTLLLPSAVQVVGAEAFAYCSKLVHFALPNREAVIGRGAFYGSTGLADADGFLILQDRLLDYFGDREDVVIPNGVTHIAEEAFAKNLIVRTVTIPHSVTHIGESAFSQCESLVSVTLSNRLTHIRSHTFAQCSNLTHLTVPGSVTIIDEFAFWKDERLTGLTICPGVTTIGKFAFCGCTALTKLTLPDTVTSIGESAFENCHSLAELTLSECLTSIGESAFTRCFQLVDLVLPRGITAVPAFLFWQCRSLAAITIPSGVTSIEDYAFADCRTLSHFEAHNGINHIGTSVFVGCKSLSVLLLPEGITGLNDVLDKAHSIPVISAPGNIPGDLELTVQKTALCVGYLCFSERYHDPALVEKYHKYIPRQKKQILHTLLELDLPKGLNRLLTVIKVNIATFEQDFLQPALDANAHQCVLVLMEWKKEHISPGDLEAIALQELNKDPFNVSDMKKLWSYEPLPEGSVRITGYKGSETDITVPPRIGKAPVTEIGEFAFHPDKPRQTKAQRTVLRNLRSVTFPPGISFIAANSCLPSVTLRIARTKQ